MAGKGPTKDPPDRKARPATLRSAAHDEVPQHQTPSVISHPGPPATLVESHNVRVFSVISSASVSAKVRGILSHLSGFSFANVSAKPGLVTIRAKSDVANKAITVMEIAKREIAQGGGKWYQYTSVTRHHLAIPTSGHSSKRKHTDVEVDASNATSSEDAVQAQQKPDAEMKDLDDSDESDPFESMSSKAGREGHAHRQREGTTAEMSIITLYLAMVRVESLRKLYGEQSNAHR
ncbi:MAG: hypothetical protein M1838_003561 [Thelocarpon superellum]|nr:MAG: hypothetical protein M1838_003561 [Thelocarpon superellum]